MGSSSAFAFPSVQGSTYALIVAPPGTSTVTGGIRLSAKFNVTTCRGLPRSSCRPRHSHVHRMPVTDSDSHVARPAGIAVGLGRGGMVVPCRRPKWYAYRTFSCTL